MTKFSVLGLPKPVSIEIYPGLADFFSRIQFIFIKPSMHEVLSLEKFLAESLKYYSFLALCFSSKH